MHLLIRLFTILLVTVTCGCSLLVSEPRVTVTQTNLIGVDTSGADIECALAISNPNSYDLTLKGYTYDLRIMTLPLASGGRQEPLPLPAGRQTDMRLPVRIKYADLLEILKRRPDPERIPYRIQAQLLLDTPLGDMPIPVNIDDTFKIPERYRPDHYLRQLLGIVAAPR